MKKENNFKVTIITTLLFIVVTLLAQPFGVIGFICGILYAQTIEWLVHGWAQHHPFKILKAYRINHMDHHRNPKEPASVQPIQYFILGSILLIGPFYWFDGFWLAYFITYLMINIIHYDLHTTNKILPAFIWNTAYFRLIESHHSKHHKGHSEDYTTHSVTNPYLDFVYGWIKLTKLNNYIAKHLKI